MANMVTIHSDELRPFDMLNEGEVVRVVTFGAMRPTTWPDHEHPAIKVEAGVLRIEEIESGVWQPTP